MTSPNSKSVKKWQAFVARLAKQSNFVYDGPIEVYSFTNSEGSSKVRIENLSQLRQVFEENAGDTNQLQLNLQATASDGVVHHTSISIRRPASRSKRRPKEKSVSSQTSDEISGDSSQTSHDSSHLATNSTSLVLNQDPSPISITHDLRSEQSSQISQPKGDLSPIKSESTRSSVVQSPTYPSSPRHDSRPSSPPKSNVRIHSPQSGPLPHIPSQAELRFDPPPPFQQPIQEIIQEEPEIPRRIQQDEERSPQVFPILPDPRAIAEAPDEQPPGPTVPPVSDTADLTASIWNLTSQLQSLIQQQQQQIAVQTANASAEIQGIQNQARSRSGSAGPVSPRHRRSEDDEKSDHLSSQQQPNVASELGQKLDQLSHHITQMGSVVDKFNESARLIHESVQNLMTTSVAIQQRQQELSMSQMNLPPNSVIMTAVQTPSGMVYYPMETQDASQSFIHAMQTSMPAFRPASIGSSYVSASGTPVLQPAQPPPQNVPQVVKFDEFLQSVNSTRSESQLPRQSSQHGSPRRMHSADLPSNSIVMLGRQHSASVSDILNSPRLGAVSPPLRIRESDVTMSQSGASNLADRSSSMPRNPSGSTGSVPSASDNTTNSQRLSASGGSHESGVSEDLKEKLRILKDMGYKNRTFNLVLLQQNDGDIESVLADLKQFEQYK